MSYLNSEAAVTDYAIHGAFWLFLIVMVQGLAHPPVILTAEQEAAMKVAAPWRKEVDYIRAAGSQLQTCLALNPPVLNTPAQINERCGDHARRLQYHTQQAEAVKPSEEVLASVREVWRLEREHRAKRDGTATAASE